MADPERTAAFLESLTAGYACRSWFCRDRGPYQTPSLDSLPAISSSAIVQPVNPHSTGVYQAI